MRVRWWVRDIRAVMVGVLLLWSRAVVEPLPPTALSGGGEGGLLPTLAVTLSPPVVQGAFRWEAETAGLVTLLIEVGLAGAAPLTTVQWTGAISLQGSPASLQVVLDLCAPETECVRTSAMGSQDDPALAVARVVQAASVRLRRGAVGPPRSLPRSRDRYAQLILGRSAAVGYGLLPATAPEDLGNSRRDPAARAPFLDPTMPEAWWEQARQNPDPPTVAALLERAAALEPGSTLRLADEAAVRGQLGECSTAWTLWQEVEARAPREARFILPRARAALCVGELTAAAAALDAITAVGVAEVDALRVQLAEAVGPGEDYDTLLARWQSSAPDDPEPIRRRIHLRIREERLADALSLVPLLAERGEAGEAQRLQLALAANLGDHEQAALAALAQDLPAEARRLRLGPTAVTALPADAPATEQAALGWHHLDAGATAAALAAADLALQQAPWLPEALALRATALEALGRTDDAQDARARLYRVDPAWPRSPR